MEKKTWQDTYKLNDEKVDQQHKYLFELAEQALQARNRDAAINCAMNLFKLMREHFRDEEALMKQSLYPALNEHVAAHNQLLEILVKMSGDIAEAIDATALHDFMWNRFLPHTLEMDMLFGKFQSQQSAKGSSAE